MINWLKNNKKAIISCSVAFLLLVSLLVVLVLVYHFGNMNDASLSQEVLGNNMVSTLANEVITNDPAKIDLPNWANLVIVIGIFVIIGIFGIGIIILVVYICVYFWKRRHAKYGATIKEVEVDSGDGMHDYIKLSISEKGSVNEEEK